MFYTQRNVSKKRVSDCDFGICARKRYDTVDTTMVLFRGMESSLYEKKKEKEKRNDSVFCLFFFLKISMGTLVEKDQAGYWGPGWGWNTVHWGSDLCGTWVSWPHLLFCIHNLGTAKRHVLMQAIPAVTTANTIKWTWKQTPAKIIQVSRPGL